MIPQPQEAGMKLRDILVPTALVVLVCSLAALGQQAGTASGTLTVNGKAVQLKHAYAQASKNNPEDANEFVRVLLSDVPIPPLKMGANALRKMAKDGKLHAVEVSLTKDDTIGATVFDPSIDDGYVPAGSSAKFEAKVFDGKTAAGRLFTEEEGSFFDTHYKFDVTFRAAVAPYPLSLSDAEKAAIAAEKPGTASGEFTVNDQTTKLAYAYAVGRREFPGDPEKIFLVLSDAPIPEDVLLAGFGMQSLADEGKVRAVEVEVDSNREPKGGQLYHQAFAKGGGGASVSVSGMHYFLPATFDANTVAGKLLMKEGDDFFGTEYYYSATFRAPVMRKPPPTYEGAKAPLSGPGKAATSFMSAARLGNKLALKKVVTPQMAKQLDGPDGTMILKMAKASFPVGMKVVEVTEKGDTAEVVAMKGGKGSRETVRLHALKIDGQWKVGQPGGEEKPAAPPREPPTPEQIAAAKTGPGKTLLAFADAIHEKNVAKMKALSADPAELKDLEGPFGDMALGILSAVFPWDLRITRVTQSGSTAQVEAESAQAKEPLKVDMVLIKGVWKIAPKPKQP
jgi:hypothetical protein